MSLFADNMNIYVKKQNKTEKHPRTSELSKAIG